MSDSYSDFRAAMLAALGHAPERIEAGRLHRFPTNDRRGDLSGWCRLFPGLEAGAYGCFRQGVSEVWIADEQAPMTRAERAALRLRLAQERAERRREQERTWRCNAERIAFFWRECRPVTEGDPVHRYLCRRLATDDFRAPACLRLHPAMPYAHEGKVVGRWPAMVAPLVGPGGDMLALHRTYLAGDGRKADVPGPVKKLTSAAGLLMGASIRLAAPRAGVLGVAEGIETALAASCLSGVPTVAAYSAGALARYVWPAGVQRLVIFGDADCIGRDAAEALRVRARAARLHCETRTPPDDGTDWCDVVATVRGVEGAA